ncbi:MAG: GNAT family N-acetyltransferase, partial [Candidatus Obscuribacterales bacterium]|nr:GNAT family N-acetyltransferase [Candidatus Obscuribacterales bacterium]
MIKIGPLLTSEYKQAATLLKLQAEVVNESSESEDSELVLRSLAFWQHWLPCQLHMAPSMYVAREDSQLVGIISLQHMSKSKTCWQINKLVVHPEHRGRGIAQELLRYV